MNILTELLYKPVMYFWNDLVLLIIKSPPNILHSLMIDTLIISLNKPHYICSGNGNSWEKCQSVYWPGYLPHQWSSNGELIAVLFFDPINLNREIIKKNMQKDCGDYLTGIKNEQYAIDCLLHIHDNHPDSATTYGLLNSIFQSKFKENSTSRLIDKRVYNIVSHIKYDPAAKHTVRDLATMINLSESRLEHLFKEEMNISISSIRKYYRIADVSKSMSHHKSLTDAALDMGFTDLSHYSKTFKQLFGSNPSVIHNGEKKLSIHHSLNR